MLHHASLVAAIASLAIATPAIAQSIVPAADGIGTLVHSDGSTYTLHGGSQAGDNLFHSFQRFGLSPGEIAHFLAQPSTRTILARVVGGEASVIDGLIQVTGGQPHLYLMNPAGLLFGAQASLNVPADFVATTATGIGFDGGGWFNASGPLELAQLVGTPSHLAFDLASPAPLVNAGSLSVAPGQQLALLGGSVAHTGTLAAPGGTIVVSAVPGTSLVRLSQPGHLLSLEIEPPRTEQGNGLPVSALDLPALLTGRPPGVTEIAGTVTTAAATGRGGQIDVLGDRVALSGATIDASGATGGGSIRIGGDYQGQGQLYRAQQTYVDAHSMVAANALDSGDGGRIILWADRATGFFGHITARGGATAGDGGFVEVSGKETLIFRGAVDTSAPQGHFGTLLLDPTDILIRNGLGDGDDLGGFTAWFGNNPGGDNGQVLAGDAAPTVIWESEIEGLLGNTNIIIQATRHITIEDLTDDFLTFAPGTGSIAFLADADGDGIGSFSMNVNDRISTGGRSISIQGASLTIGTIDNANNADVGNVTLTAVNGDLRVANIGLNFSDAGGAGNHIALNAPSGTVYLTGNTAGGGFIQAGQVGKTSDSTISITAARFRATNPMVAVATGPDGTTNIPLSLYAFPAAVPNLVAPAVPTVSGKFVLELAGDPVPKVVGTGNTLIHLRLLQDNQFTVGQPLGSSSGTVGLIGIGIDSIPPRVLVLPLNNIFTAEIPQAPAATEGATPAVSFNPSTLETRTAAAIACVPEADKGQILEIALAGLERAAAGEELPNLPASESPCTNQN